MNYKNYVHMVRRSRERINKLANNFASNDKYALISIGVELRHMEALTDEAFDMDFISLNSYKLLHKWVKRYYDTVIQKAIES